MPEEFTLEAKGPDEYQYFEIPTNFKEDKYVQLAEARPGNRDVVHHIIAFVQPPSKDGNQQAHKLSKEEIEKYARPVGEGFDLSQGRLFDEDEAGRPRLR